MPSKKIDDIIQRLKIRISVFKPEELDITLRQRLMFSENTIIDEADYIYLYSQGSIFRADSSDYAMDVMELLNACLQQDEHSEKARTENDAYRMILLGRCNPQETLLLLKQYGIPEERNRIVLYFEKQDSFHGSELSDLLKNTVLFDGKDKLIEINESAFAVIHETDPEEYAGDLCEFAQALCDTAESEIGIRLVAGISSSCALGSELSIAMQQARETVEIEKTFSIKGTHAYHELLLERIIRDIPAEIGTRYKKQFMTDKITKLLNEEMIETVSTFFQCDLNVSDTSRQMFIHRNTLMYRLDKIQKFTGLDLRKFRDAVVFQIMMKLSLC